MRHGLKKRCLFLALLFALSFHTAASADVKEKEFVPRTEAPSLTDELYCYPRNYFSSDNGRGNCTWYAYGRAWEILGRAPVFDGDAKKWWDYREEYSGYGDINSPRVGAIAVWDGEYGHVAVVEQVYEDGSVDLSESSLNETGEGVWYTKTYWGEKKYTKAEILDLPDTKGNEMNFLGYIYLLENGDGKTS